MSKLSKRAKEIFGVAWMSAAILAAILLAQWAFGQDRQPVERPPVPFAESAVTATAPRVAEVEHYVTFSETTVAEQVHVAASIVVMVPDPGVTSVSPGNPMDATELSVATGVTNIDDPQQAADVGVVMMNADIYAIARHDPAATFPWVSPWELRDNQFDGAVVDSARATALLLSCDDEPALREYLTGKGLTLRQPDTLASPTRALPDFTTGVVCYTYSSAYCDEEQEALESIDPPAGVTVLRFVDRSDRAVAFALAHPDREIFVIADTNGLSVDALRVLAGSNVVGVIVGHYRHADDEPVDFAASAADVMRVTRAVRLVSDAPVLLAVGVVNIHTRDTERGWADAFGDDLETFDGFALYGLARFPAVLEAVENPRELILRRMGLPDRPCILIEFVGTSFQYGADERGYVEKVWAARAKPLLAALRKQQWRGLVTWSATTDDARIKAHALRGAMPAQPQSQSQAQEPPQ